MAQRSGIVRVSIQRMKRRGYWYNNILSDRTGMYVGGDHGTWAESSMKES